jgi:hypothetical protein
MMLADDDSLNIGEDLVAGLLNLGHWYPSRAGAPAGGRAR